ncbi:MAG: alpha/beta fold hydrolase [Rhodospirillaceae bacterium]|nr:alpha/beta fold hydrolase [Rhodospirillaceae bacterium]
MDHPLPPPLPPTPRPMPRQGPRPLPLHLAMEGWLLQMSFAGLTPAWTESSKGLAHLNGLLSTPLQKLLAEQSSQSPSDIANDWRSQFNPVAFVEALTREAKARMEQLARGITRYQNHAYRRTRVAPPPVWTNGSAVVRDYGGGGVPTLFVPSLVNKAYILDLAEDRSLMDFAAHHGVHAYLLDWGAPDHAERQFHLEDYICGVLIPALEHVKAITGQTPQLVGYCMGGTLATAVAVLRPDVVSGLVLLATPWDFHVDSGATRLFLAQFKPFIDMMLNGTGVASVDFLQAMFASLDPTLVSRKFRGFAARDTETDAARRFVELEDWLNDGVDLAGPAARETFFTWYGDNAPKNAQWRIDGRVIDPRQISTRSLALIPSQDRIVPPASALALAQQIPGCDTRQVDLGHIGMIAGGSAAEKVYAPLVRWLEKA